MLRKFIHIFRETFKHPEHPKRHEVPEQKRTQSRESQTHDAEAAEPHSMTKEEKLNEALKDSFPASDPISTGR